MIKQFFEWLKGLYYTPAATAETQSSGVTMSEPLVDASVGTAAQAQPAAVEFQVATSTSALDKAKADFEAFVAFVEHGIEVLGQDAEAELVALKDKYL